MKPNELFDLIAEDRGYICTGDNVDWKIKVDHDEKVMRLLFKCTDSQRDWKNNLNFPAKVYKEGKLMAARGWGDAYRSANDVIMKEFIYQFCRTINYRVEIAGWSYGGAMALLAAEDFHFRLSRKPDVVTFGCPKVLFGRKSVDYVRSCCNSVAQYAHVNDCVPLMPLFHSHVNRIRVGKGFSPFSLLNPQRWHCEYTNPELY